MHRLLYRYDLANESALLAIALPPPFNVFFLMADVVGWCLHYEHIKYLYPDCNRGRRFGLFISRNSAIHPSVSKRSGPGAPQQEYEAFLADERQQLSLMERARAMVLQESEDDSLVAKVDRISLDLRQSLAQGGNASQVEEDGARNAAARIRKLNTLLEQQLITQREYDGQKAAIIASV